MKVLVVGYGSIGKRHVNNILSLGHEVIVFTKKKQIELPNAKIRICNTLNDCLQYDPKVAVIANVTSNHIPIAIKLAKRNIDLFIEKPLSNNSNNIKKLQRIIRQKKLITMVGCNLRFHKCINKIKKMVSTDKLGKIISVQAESSSYLPDWHPDEDYRTSYAARNELGGGVILTCIHELDYLYWFFGQIKEIVAFSDKLSQLEISVEDYAAIIAKFQNGVVAEIHLDFFQRPPTSRCKIVGTKGTILWESIKNQVLFYNIKKKKWTKEFEIKKFNRNEMYLNEMSYFLNCVKKRKKPMNGVKENFEILNVALKIKRFYKKRGRF